jgi:peptidase M23-like protein
MPRTALALFALVVLSVALEGTGTALASTGERWRRPLPGGTVVGSFSFERSAPYVRGRRRGVDLAGRAGQRVVAPCGGVVTHAGRVPAFGRGVSLRCGRWVATELGLAAIAVTRGAHVLPGATVGRLDATATLRLGARRAGDRHGYVDPLALLAEAPSLPPAVAPPARRSRRTGPPRGAPAPHTTRAPAPAAAHRPAAPALPVPVLAGLALLTVGLAGGGAARVHRRRRPGAGIALAQR